MGAKRENVAFLFERQFKRDYPVATICPAAALYTSKHRHRRAQHDAPWFEGRVRPNP